MESGADESAYLTSSSTPSLVDEQYVAVWYCRYVAEPIVLDTCREPTPSTTTLAYTD
jgi:hypothetical protein